MSRRGKSRADRRLWLLLVVVGLGSFIYLPTVRYGFTWDDTSLIRDNPDLTVGNPLLLFGRSFAVLAASGDYQKNQYYRPLVSLSLWLDRHIQGPAPAGYHRTNVLLNLAVSVLVALVLLRILSSFWAALLGGLAFALHPMHVETVAFTAGRTDIMMSAFVLLALLALFEFRRRAGWGRVAVILVLYIAALLCKEAAILLPALALLVVGWPMRGESRPEGRSHKIVLFGAFVVVSIVYLLIRSSVLRGYAPKWEDVDLGARALLILNAFGRYVYITLSPFIHRLVYPGPGTFAVFGWPTLLGSAALVGLVALVVRFRAAPVGLGSAWFLCFMLPACNFFPPGVSFLAERLVYLPSAGLILLVAFLGFKAARTPSLARALVVVVFIYCGAMGANALGRLPIWRDNMALYTQMVKESPDSPHARDNLGVELKEAGDLPGAIREHREAVRLLSDHAPAHNNLGSALLESGNLKEAITEYQTAVRLAPEFALARNNLGVALQISGDNPAAEAEFRRAIALQPNQALAHNNLGEILMARRQLDSAIVEFRQAVANQPDYVLAHYNLGIIYKSRGQTAEAERELRRAVELKPDFILAQDSLKALRR